ncbi:hypothetical protein XENTR_v10021339 [Xenopus tropicalis]|uniref:WD repeat-containing protein 62 isoform X2 n=1 Tax=Xenopus tropicalis TaxID=8364 RepID=A0A8J0T5P3_XENTR|nr:WD repeat-containing protein 62 isoform X2 [Xenopus tropicalis]KAE8585529.1 hypothetical protein XENTR_v10021339 [Xenopus tropicalis]|eukprot:XP_017952348.1 PREDICTED: WD repeat-containing protein 62 isoform X2 [Xenopus tropicalis]
MSDCSEHGRNIHGFQPQPPSPGRRKSSRVQSGNAGNGRGHRQVELEKVLGITVSSNSSITCDPISGLIAYPAGCVIVVLCPRKNKQTHIFNTCRKPLSALSFSPNGKFIVTGESGHNPAVRIWDVAEKVLVSEMLGHKYGVSCVCFSPDMKYVVSVGYQHDMVINVWDWKVNMIVAKNKVSSKVSAVSFSEDSSYFVTVGSRHVKFWYLETSKKIQVNGTVPLVGRSGLLGDLHDNIFCGVACGKGSNSRSTFCIAYSGVLCQFTDKRVLEKWIKLKVSASYCLAVTELFVFCGCEDGIVRIFNAQNLQYITDLPKPHYLGVDVSLGTDPSTLFTKQTDSSYPDTSALVYDERNQWLCCVYNDHSLYVWDVNDTRKVGKVYSGLYHSSFVWNIEVFPELGERPCLPSGCFFSCSSDNTIRLWNIERNANLYLGKNIYSNDLHKVIYVDNNIEHLKDTSSMAEKSDVRDTKSGIRVLKIRPDGQHLASGDRTGNIRIYDLGIFDELLTIEAHDGEVLCLEYSKPSTGVTLLASASRDRLIHVLNAEKDYILEQTLDDHSSSITAVKFAGDQEEILMISCGADKSIYFRPAQMLPDGIHFSRLHHTVEKTAMYDMDVDVSQKTVAVACQDKNIRLYSISSGKQEKILKSSPNGGALLKVQIDPSGTFFTTSCSSKNISFFDLLSGECIAEVYGHSDLVTDMKFTNDCKRLITVSGDSCVFIWKLDPAMTACMKQRLIELGIFGEQKTTCYDECLLNNRRETYITNLLGESVQNEIFMDSSYETDDSSTQTPSKKTNEADPAFLKTNGKMPLWVRKLDKDQDPLLNQNTINVYQPRGRWAQSDSNIIIMKSLDTEDKSYCFSPDQEETGHFFLHDKTDFVFAEPQNFQHLLESEERNVHSLANETCVQDLSDEDSDVKSHSLDSNGGIFYPSSLQLSGQEESDYAIEEHQIFSDTFDMSDVRTMHDFLPSCHQDKDEESLTSETCSEADLDENELPGTSQPHTPEEEKFLLKHFDTLIDDFSEERFDYSLKDLKPPDDDDHDFIQNPRLSFSAKFLSRCQKTSRPENSDLPLEQQVKTPSPILGNDEQISHSKTFSEPTEDKLLDTLEKNKNVNATDFSKLCHLQKVQMNEKVASRSSFPPCVSSKNGAFNKPKKGRSYMDATASSKAKIFRSVSMGDSLNTSHSEGQKKLSNLSRPASSNDLLSLEQNNCYNAEDNLCDPAPILTTNKPATSGYMNEHVQDSPDKLLMPPPLSCVVIPRLKRKAQSASNLAKPPGKEDQHDIVRKNKNKESRRSGVENSINTKNSFRRSSLTTSKTANMADSSRRASVAEIPTCKNEFQEVEDHKNESHMVAVVTSNEMATLSTMPFASNHDSHGAKVLLGKCEAVIENLCSAFQKTLELYSEIDICGGSHEEKQQMKSLFYASFNHIRSEMDLIETDQNTNTANNKNSRRNEHQERNPTLDLLEHYSEMMLKVMKEKIASN